MGTVVIQWYAAEVAGYSEIVANPPRFQDERSFCLSLHSFYHRKYASLCKNLRRNVFNSSGYWCDNPHSKAVTGSKGFRLYFLCLYFAI